MSSTLAPGFEIADCYRILNVSPGEEWEAVRKSYRALARQHHPDLNPGCHGQRIREITLAYQTLRRHHPRANAGPGRFHDSSAPPGGDSQLDRLLMRLRGQAARLCQGRWGLDVVKDIEVEALTAAQGGTVRVRRGGESFEVNLPPGTRRGARLRVPGKGEAGLLGGKRGDLLLNIRVRRPRAAEPVHHHEIAVERSRIREGRMLTLATEDGPIRFFLPRLVRDGQTFILKSRPGGEGACHVVTVRLV